jgi:hypothetical protein
VSMCRQMFGTLYVFIPDYSESRANSDLFYYRLPPLNDGEHLMVR